MSDENKAPTDAAKDATSQVLKNIAQLLRSGLFVGQNAEHVASAIKWLEEGVSFFGTLPEAASLPANASKPDLTVVPDGNDAS